MSAQDIGKRLRSEIDRLGGVAWAVDLLGVSRNTVYNWASNPSATPEHLALLDQQGADIHYILTGAGKAGEAAQEYRVERCISANNVPYNSDDYVLVPFYDIALSAGGGAEVLDEQAKAWNAWRRDYVAKRGLVADQLAEFSVQGDSMSPELNNGDTVLVDRRATDVVAEAIYVIRIENALMVKYCRREPPDGILLRSANPSYQNQLVTPERFPQWHFKVVGRVVRQGRDR